MSELASTRPRRVDGLTCSTLPDGTGQVTSADAKTITVLNPTARALWELCDGQTATEEMVAAVLVLFDVSQDQARQDVTHALQELQRAGAVE